MVLHLDLQSHTNGEEDDEDDEEEDDDEEDESDAAAALLFEPTRLAIESVVDAADTQPRKFAPT